MVHHIDAQHSNFTTSGDAFAGTGPDTLIVDADAFLITTDSVGFGANLSGSWTATINGAVTTLGNAGSGLRVGGGATVSKVTIGKTGDVSGQNIGMEFGGAGSIANKGTISGSIAAKFDLFGDVTFKNAGAIEGGEAINLAGSGTFTLVNSGSIGGFIFCSLPLPAHITNSGLIGDNVLLGSDADILTNFVKTGTHIKSGTIAGLIDLGDGGDTFKGGAHAETVRDSLGTDHYNLGGGNDTYLAEFSGSDTDGADVVNGGAGIDTYDRTAAAGIFIVNIDTKDHETTQGTVFAQTAFVVFGQTDHVIGFENVNGGDGVDIIVGSGGANVLNGGANNDILYGNNGNDTLIGGSGADKLHGGAGRDIMTGGPSGSSELDTFVFDKLSDSGVKASTRDLITDFVASGPDADIIDLSAIHAKGGGALFFINFGHFEGAPGQVRESFSGGNTIVSGDVNGDGNADFSIALKGHLFLSDADFQFV
jgi:serralysin